MRLYSNLLGYDFRSVYPRLICCLMIGGLVVPALAQRTVPVLTGRVVDNADILSLQKEQQLDVMLGTHEEATSNQIAVLTVVSLEEEAIEDFALRVARAWQLGTAQHNNGVLLLVALQDREMRIEVGVGLEGDLPDAMAARILRYELRPHFRDGDYGAGVQAGVKAILGTLEGTYTPPESREAPPFWFGLAFMIIPIIFAFTGVFSKGFARWFLFLFLMPFFWVSGFGLFGSSTGAWGMVGLCAVLFLAATRHPKVREVAKKLGDGKKAKIGPFTFSSGGSGGSFSSGGFSGGGGSFGGGGASGSW